MTRYHNSVGVCLVMMFGLWGCAKGPASQNPYASAERIKTLEAKANRLEEELKSAVAAKEQLDENLNEAEEYANELHQEIARLQAVEKERNELKALLRTRTAERDLLHARYEGFLNELNELTGRAKAVLQSPNPTVSGVAGAEARSKPVSSGDFRGVSNPKPRDGAASEPTGPFLNGGF